jgi:hypothetical protein
MRRTCCGWPPPWNSPANLPQPASQNLPLPHVAESASAPGRGVTAPVDGRRVAEAPRMSCPRAGGTGGRVTPWPRRGTIMAELEAAGRTPVVVLSALRISQTVEGADRGAEAGEFAVDSP